MLKLTRPLVCFDLESTGVDPVEDRIVEFGCSVLMPDGSRFQWESRFNPGRPSCPEAIEKHHITDDMLVDCPPFSVHAARIHKGLQNRDIAGYNCRGLDLPLLDEELRRCGLRLDLTGVNVIDAAGIFFKKEKRDLEAAVRKYCNREHVDAHGAAADASATLDVLDGQLAMYEELRELDLAGLDAFSKRDEVEYIDLAGKLYRDSDGFARYSIGKSKDQRVKDDPGFARWMLNKSFCGNTLDAVRAELGRFNL